MRYRIVRFLHMRNVHAFCHRSVRRWELASYRLDDGTLWTPDITGVLPTYEVHTP